jgi:hypothetical protein
METKNLTNDIQSRKVHDPIPPSRYIIMILVIIIAGWWVPQATLGGRFAQIALAFALLAVALVAFLRWPGIGFPLLVLSAMIVPLSISTGTQSGINVSILLTTLLIGVWLFDKIALQRNLRMLPERIIPPLLAIIIVSIISFGFGQFNWFPIDPVPLTTQIGGLALFILTPGIILLTAHRLRDVRSLEWSTWLFLGLGGIFILTLLVPSIEHIGRQVFQRGVVDSLFWAWIAAIAFSQSWLNTKLKLRYRFAIALVGFGAFYFTIVLHQAWISGWLPAAVAVLTIIGINRPKWAVFGVMILGMIFVVEGGFFNAIFLTGDNVYSLSTRLDAWRVMFEIIRVNPLLGLGPASYYGYTPLFSIMGYNVNFNSHNNYIDLIAQIGIVGLGSFIWFVWELGRTIWRKRDSVPDGYPRAYMHGALGGLAAVLVSGMLGDWFLPFVYNIDNRERLCSEVRLSQSSLRESVFHPASIIYCHV